MAYEDGNYDTPYQANPTTVNPPDPNGPGSNVWNWVGQVYQSATGRAPENDDVIRQWIQGTGGDFAKIQQGIYATPEAQAYGSRNAQAPAAGPDAPTPTPTPTPSPTPGPVAPPVAAPGPAAPPVAGPAAPALPSVSPPPPVVAPPPFTYDKFSAPDPSRVADDPRYKVMRDEGLMAIGHKNAALGTLNTGGTIGDYVGFASNLASKSYDDIWNQDYAAYNTNRGNAFDAYKTNYGIGKDVSDTNYAEQYKDPFAMEMQKAGVQQQGNQFNAQLGQQASQFNSTMDFDKWLQNYKMTVTDPFDMKYKTLSLY